MKKKIIIIIAMLLALCFFSSCDSNEETAPTSSNPPAGDSTTAPSEDVPPSPPVYADLKLDASSILNYKIIRSDDASVKEKRIARELCEKLNESFGVSLSAESDFLFGGQQPGKYEILIGDTNREESQKIYGDIKYNDYVVCVYGSKIMISGGCVDALSKAAEHFCSLLSGDTLSLAGDYSYESRAEYKYSSMTLGGVGISKYNIIYSGDGQLVAANIIADKIGELSGDRLKILHNKTEKTDYEIVVGNTNRNPAESYAFYSYDIENDGKSIYLSGADLYALNYAALQTARIIEEGEEGKLDIADFSVSYRLPEHSEYIEDIDKLYMRWEYLWSPDPEMLDYEAKLESFGNVSDRLLTVAHRAECQYYPENSIESIISFYKMGGDVVELDIQATADGVLILMHDGNLKRMTNWKDFAGLTLDGITFPESNSVSAWTYEQLTYLNLKDGAGGSGAPLTNFKIPTLVEALKVCKNRLLIVPDKTNCWTYLPDGSGKPDLFSCMKEADNFESIIISYGLNDNPGAAMDIQKHIYDFSGVRPFMLVRSNGDPLNSVYNKFVELGAVNGSYGVQVNGRYDPDSFPERYKETYDALRGNVLMWGWTISDVNNGYPDSNDCEEYWESMYGVGYRMIMTNKYLDIVKYASRVSGFDS